jgi:hypothetical protein
MLTNVDHVILAVRDLDGAIAQLRDRFALYVIEGGTHPWLGTAYAVVPMDLGFLQITSVQDTALARTNPFASRIAQFLEDREGLFGFALASSEIDRDVEGLRRRGTSIGDPQREESVRSGRSRGWRAAFLPESDGVTLPFLIQHDQRSGERWKSWIAGEGGVQPFGVMGVEEVTLAVDNLRDGIMQYTRFLGLTVSRQTARIAQLDLKSGHINLVPAADTPDGRTGVYSVGIGVSGLNNARADLRTWDIPFTDDPFTTSVAAQIDPAEMFAARVDFVQS